MASKTSASSKAPRGERAVWEGTRGIWAITSLPPDGGLSPPWPAHLGKGGPTSLLRSSNSQLWTASCSFVLSRITVCWTLCWVLRPGVLASEEHRRGLTRMSIPWSNSQSPFNQALQTLVLSFTGTKAKPTAPHCLCDGDRPSNT